MRESLILDGHFEVETSDGWKFRTHNLVVDGGKLLVVTLLTTEDSNPLETVKVGSGGNAASFDQTDLVSSLASKKISRTTIGATEIVWTASFGLTDAIGTLREVGIFGKDGTMFARSVLAEKEKDSTQLMRVRYRLRVR